jgi:2-polyprenyl-3-methyl-5-hydroxy-6-metoxy-1,4-benzoquinol methylase
MQTTRRFQSTPELDRQELDWWQKFAAVEEKFCWVQTPSVQRILRKPYIKKIVSAARSGSRIAELGCGVGWLSILLAQNSNAKVVGMDFSSEQIRLANEAAIQAGVSQKVQFKVATSTELKSSADRYDLLVMHAFLHHLSICEIQDAISTAKHLIAEGGRLFLFEPVRYNDASQAAKRRLRLLVRLQNFSLGLHRRGLRKISKQEAEIRSFIAQRNVGVAPCGPSPKEIPFLPDEIPALLNGHFTIQKREPFMVSSHLIAQEILLSELSYPRLAKLLGRPILWISRFLERQILRYHCPADLWVFELFECTPIK